MDRQAIYDILHKKSEWDYEVYLNTDKLFACQKDFASLCNRDELQFQIVHQIEELWMKLIVYTLLDIIDFIEVNNTNQVLCLFKRVHLTQKLMIQQLELLETMSPKEYQEIRKCLGNGSGQESPGFRALNKLPGPLWEVFTEKYLLQHDLSVEKIYAKDYNCCDAYMVAECLAEFDELYQKFCYHHIQLIYRSIGFDSNSLKGRSVELLNERMKSKFFPELWQIRTKMTDEWGFKNGLVRDSIT